MLTDKQIRLALRQRNLSIEPFHDGSLQPVSYDVHLGRGALTESPKSGPYLDLSEPDFKQSMLPIEIPRLHDELVFTIAPGQFMLADLAEEFWFGPDIAGHLDGKSTVGRIGLFIHVTAGVFDPGWHGRPTLELYNASTRWIRLWHWMPIGQMTFYGFTDEVSRRYGDPELHSHYQGNDSVRESAGLANRSLDLTFPREAKEN